MGAIVEKDSNSVVRELVPEAVFVGVIDPFGDPLKGRAQLLFGDTVCFRHIF